MSARWSGVVLDAPDPQSLADFYRAFLGWDEGTRSPEWVVLHAPGSKRPTLSFQREDAHARPSWPAHAGEQQMQLHLDIEVDDLEAECERAVALGATLAAYQPQEGVRVLLDPVGHPFCLFLPGA